MPKLLTVAAVLRLKAKGKRREVRDAGAPGLHLIVQPSGHKSWAMRLRRPDGRPAKLTLGTAVLATEDTADDPVHGGALTLRQARELANKIDRQRAMGIDVASTEKQRKLDAAGVDSFLTLARRFIRDHAMPKRRGWRATAKALGLQYGDDGTEPTLIARGLAKRWANLPVTKITGPMLFDVVDEARRHAIPGTRKPREGVSDPRGRSMAAVLGKLFSWAAKHGYVAPNPAIGLFRPESVAEERDRTLNEDELRMLWVGLDAIGYPFGPCFKMLILTGARRSEIAEMQWSELNEDLSVFTLPKERSKNKRLHKTYLPLMARELLQSLPRIGPFLFTSNGVVPIAGFSAIKRKIDSAVPIPPWRIHDLRRTAVTMMAEIGVQPHIIEALVNHQSGHKAKVAGIYNKAEYAVEKTAALERWANHLQAIIAGRPPANVVPLHGAGR